MCLLPPLITNYRLCSSAFERVFFSGTATFDLTSMLKLFHNRLYSSCLHPRNGQAILVVVAMMIKGTSVLLGTFELAFTSFPFSSFPAWMGETWKKKTN